METPQANMEISHVLTLKTKMEPQPGGELIYQLNIKLMPSKYSTEKTVVQIDSQTSKSLLETKMTIPRMELVKMEKY